MYNPQPVPQAPPAQYYTSPADPNAYPPQQQPGYPAPSGYCPPPPQSQPPAPYPQYQPADHNMPPTGNPYADTPPIGYPAEFDQKQPDLVVAETEGETTERGWFSSSKKDEDAVDKKKNEEDRKQLQPGWKLIYYYRDSLSSYSLNASDESPLYSITHHEFSTASIRILPHKRSRPAPVSPDTPLAAAAFHAFSSRSDLCLGDPKAPGREDPWSSMTLRKDGGIVHDRWRFGMDPSLLPPGLRIVHEKKKPRKGQEGYVEFVWQRPGDSAWALDSWELVVDRDGKGKGEVLVRYKEAKMSFKRKGKVEMVHGIGRAWELVMFLSLAAVLKKETDAAMKSISSITKFGAA
ncbi:hypothetical protein EX30DRAFT_348876 [Ascodesmis nigricans]|uniref:Uncharacterized protein n=1 Tax=Ascodesmis nigricans TaxID=341454 RepID=A0A4V3SIP9_9PEZI|nr:hypothetical protein EX30DRAFT_348876 [Ascodesmis nigricans]